MTRHTLSGRTRSRRMAALSLLVVLAACNADPTGTATRSVSADPPALVPRHNGEICVDYITDDSPRICVAGDGFDGEKIRDPLSGEVMCTCVFAGTF